MLFYMQEALAAGRPRRFFYPIPIRVSRLCVLVEPQGPGAYWPGFTQQAGGRMPR